MKTTLPHFTLAIVLVYAAPGLAQGVRPGDEAVMPGTSNSKPVIAGGNANPHEAHASATCAKGPNAAEANATRPECANMGLPPPKGPTTSNGMTTGSAGSGSVGVSAIPSR